MAQTVVMLAIIAESVAPTRNVLTMPLCRTSYGSVNGAMPEVGCHSLRGGLDLSAGSASEPAEGSEPRL